ncbi:MAG: PAS domain-containing sensor histidine kinase [Tatlockia sp.]|jgi:signal transduction histidine kinase
MSVESMEKLQTLIDEKNREINQLKECLEQEKLAHEEELKYVHDYYENILAVLPGHVYWLDKNNIFLGCNNSQAQNAKLNSRKDIVGKTNYDMPWKDQADELNKLNNLVMETGEPHVAEEYAVMSHGLAIYLSQKTPLRNNRNEIVGVLGVSIDITERKKMEVAVRRAKETAELANHAKTEFITHMSQDIKTPLAGIVALSGYLAHNVQNEAEKQYAGWIKNSSKALLVLLDKVLMVIADEQMNNNEVHEALFDIREEIQSMIDLVQPNITLKKLHLVVDIEENVPQKIITDGVKLQRILLNLISNAIKFTEKGSITIQVQTLLDTKEYVQLKFGVLDTGIGIADEHKSRIFERFFCVNPCPNESNQGVGLHIAQNYVSLLGGEIQVESERNQGSHFHFTLPIKVANA